MSPKRRIYLSLVFACICLSKSLLIKLIINGEMSEKWAGLGLTSKKGQEAGLTGKNGREIGI